MHACFLISEPSKPFTYINWLNIIELQFEKYLINTDP